MNNHKFINFLTSIKRPENHLLLEAIETGFSIIMENENSIKEYPLVGKFVSGLEVRKSVPNTDSISASMTEYTVLRGIREVPMSEFFNTGEPHSKDEYVNRLAHMISESKEINPLIVVIDEEGPYVLEGVHRLDALHILGVSTLPALVVIDEDIRPISEPLNENCFESTFTEKEGRVFINPRSLSSTELSKINTFMKRKGYDWRGSEDALNLLMRTADKGYEGDMADAIKSAISPPKKQDISTKAARHFGTTSNPLEAGYMTPRGTLLDFSGRKEGGSGLISGTRNLDHSEVNAVTNKSGWEGKLDFMNHGNIRLYPENGGINLTKPLTQEQRRSLGNWFRYFKDKEIPIEINKEDGETVFEKRYPSKISSYVILRDIDNYFSGKTESLNEGIGKFAGMAVLVLSSLFPNLSHSNESKVKKFAMELPEFKQLVKAKRDRENFINFRKSEEEMYNRNVEDMGLSAGESILLNNSGDSFTRIVGEKDPRFSQDSLGLANNSKLIDSLSNKVLEKINKFKNQHK